jgi:hypothetical protein
MNRNHSEHGQAIILIAFILIALFAFGALAIDGGRIYAERRRLQSAADAAAMAAANAAANGDMVPAVVNAALDQAALNDVVDNDAAVNPAKNVDVIVNNPPATGPYAGNADYYQVVVRTTQPATLAAIFNPGTSTIEASAVSHVIQARTIAGDSALQSLVPTGSGIIIGSGTTKTTVTLTGGDIASNSGVTKNSKSVITVTQGKVFSKGTWTNTTSVSPVPLQNQPAVDVTGILQPVCPTNHFTTNAYVNPTTTVLKPGYYDHEVWLGVSGRSYKLNPGVYCFNNGLVVTNGANLTGSNVLLIMVNGEFRFNGTGIISLSRAQNIKDSAGNQFGGLLLYGTPGASTLPEGTSYAPNFPGLGVGISKGGSSSACTIKPRWLLEPILDHLFGRVVDRPMGCPTQSKDFNISGGGTSSYTGTIYNPEHDCTATGASTVTINGSIVCDTITLTGTTVVINHKPSQGYQLPPSVELAQ